MSKRNDTASYIGLAILVVSIVVGIFIEPSNEASKAATKMNVQPSQVVTIQHAMRRY